MNILRKLPAKIKVKVIESDSGNYVAVLPEYNIHTEADTRSGLDIMINDLIYAYFDVPRKHWGKVVYSKLVEGAKPKLDVRKLIFYQKYVASKYINQYK